MYNLKSNKKQSQVKAYEKMLLNQTEDNKNSLEGQVPPNYNGLLESQRDAVDPIIQEARLDKKRDDSIDAASEGTIEANMDKNIVLTQRANIDKFQIKPNDILSEAYDQKKSDVSSRIKSQESGSDFWDKYIGSQLSNDKTVVSGQVPVKGSQLGNRSERFENFNGVPKDLDQSNNIGVHLEKNKIKPMTGYKKASNIITDSLRDADAMLFHIYAKASIESRELNIAEKSLINGINRDKVRILSFLDKSSQWDPIKREWPEGLGKGYDGRFEEPPFEIPEEFSTEVGDNIDQQYDEYTEKGEIPKSLNVPPSDQAEDIQGNFGLSNQGNEYLDDEALQERSDYYKTTDDGDLDWDDVETPF